MISYRSYLNPELQANRMLQYSISCPELLDQEAEKCNKPNPTRKQKINICTKQSVTRWPLYGQTHLNRVARGSSSFSLPDGPTRCLKTLKAKHNSSSLFVCMSVLRQRWASLSPRNAPITSPTVNNNTAISPLGKHAFLYEDLIPQLLSSRVQYSPMHLSPSIQFLPFDR